MADYSKPAITDLYTDVLQSVRDNIADVAKMQDGSSNINLPVGAIRFLSANRRWERWDGSTWAELIPKGTSSYAFNVPLLTGICPTALPAV